MTSNFKGIEPPLPAGNRLIPPPSLRAGPNNLQPPPRSYHRQTSCPNAKAPARVHPNEASEPPQKRQKLENTVGSQSKSTADRDTPKPPIPNHNANSFEISNVDNTKKDPRSHQNPLFPFRPDRNSGSGTTLQGRALAIERAARKDVVPIKAYVPEPPSSAPRYHPAGPADFFPWTGNHAEDILNELTTKQGFYDKVQPSQNESGTARPSVWSSLKHKSGLQILSSLLVSALDQRQSHGTITAQSTFKPPPRVTLTDTKREAWLRDLANPSIPLRRLSRTIPHGIRGKLLLDHCLSKGIPTSRATWLAKCVGANEIRAFKRKGTAGVFTVGGETKWINDWTLNIEQFLESIIGACGSPDWNAKIDYGLRLASHLYSNRLLDQDHYLDWLMASIETSDLDNLPIWFLVQQIHQREIIAHRQRGRRLVAATLGHLHEMWLRSNDEIYIPVRQQIVQLLRSLLVSSPACFLLPSIWDKYKDLIHDCLLGKDSEHLRPCFESISYRNSSLQSYTTRQIKQDHRSSRQRLIGLLDSLVIKPNFGRIAGACLRLETDRDVLVKTCIEWSCTVHRQGLFRKYAALRLLRTWSRQGVHLQEPICDFLAANPDPASLSKRDLYGLLAGLISSRHLSVGRYLQWIMARGVLHGQYRPGPDCPCDIGLLFEIPSHGLPSQLLNLRQTLLSSTLGITPEYEAEVIASTKAKIEDQIPSLFATAKRVSSSNTPDYQPLVSSQTVSSVIARWIRQSVIQSLQSYGPNDPTLEEQDQGSKRSSSAAYSIVNLEQFHKLRHILEDLMEFTVLADVMSLISNGVEDPTLAAIIDTVHYYFDVFNAIGAAEDLFRKVHQRVEMRSQRDFDLGFLESLIDLAARFSETDQEIRRLRQAISAQAPKPSAAACSPISDTMVEAVQSSEPTFADEMDQMLVNGTSMDKQTLTRIFGTIIIHYERSLDVSSHLVNRHSHLLACLRGFGPRTFDLLLNDWLHRWLPAGGSTRFSMSLAPMICSKVISLKTILNAVQRIMDGENDPCQKADLALQTIDFISETSSGNMTNTGLPSYRIYGQLHELVQKSPDSILAVLRAVSEARKAGDVPTGARADKRARSREVQNLAQSIVLQQTQLIEEANPATDSSHLDIDLQIAIGSILHSGRLMGVTGSGLHDQVVSIFQNISDFNMSMSQLEFKAVLALNRPSLEDCTHLLSEIVIEQASTASLDHIRLWQCLLSGISKEQAFSIREKAEAQVLNVLNDDNDDVNETGTRIIPSLLLIIEASSFSSPSPESSPLIERVGDGLSALLPSNNSDKVQLQKVQLRHLDVLLRLLVVHQSTIQHPRYPQNTLFHLLLSLSLLLIHSALDPHPAYTCRIFDVLSLLTDTLCADTRSRCIRSLRDHYRNRDPRLRFIFGYSESTDNEWLQLEMKASQGTETKPEGTAIASSTKPYVLRPFEMMQDATPFPTENDTSLSLTLFGSKKSVL